MIWPCASYVTYGTANVEPLVAAFVPAVPAVTELLCLNCVPERLNPVPAVYVVLLKLASLGTDFAIV